VLGEILARGRVRRAWLGVGRADPCARPPAGPLHGLSQRSAVEILSVSRRSPAAAAGIEEGDLLVRLDEREVSSIDELQAILRDWPNRQAGCAARPPPWEASCS